MTDVVRMRNCTDPGTSEVLPWSDCGGEEEADTDVQECGTTQCACECLLDILLHFLRDPRGLSESDWSAWDPWTSCPVPCGGSWQSRGRSCLDGTTGLPTGNDADCGTHPNPELQICNEAECTGKLHMETPKQWLYTA